MPLENQLDLFCRVENGSIALQNAVPKQMEKRSFKKKEHLHQDYIIDAGVIELILQHSNWMNIRNALVPITFSRPFVRVSERASEQMSERALTRSLSIDTFYIFIVMYRLLDFFFFIDVLFLLFFHIKVSKSTATMLQMTRSSSCSLQFTWNIIFMHRKVIPCKWVYETYTSTELCWLNSEIELTTFSTLELVAAFFSLLSHDSRQRVKENLHAKVKEKLFSSFLCIYFIEQYVMWVGFSQFIVGF